MPAPCVCRVPFPPDDANHSSDRCARRRGCALCERDMLAWLSYTARLLEAVGTTEVAKFCRNTIEGIESGAHVGAAGKE